MTGTIGILDALILLTIVLAAVFLVRPSITAGVTGKILAFVGLCVLPALCIDTGMSFHMQRSQQTAYCISCHSMETHGQSLYVLSPNYIPAQHFQNHLVLPDKACYTCHTDYTMYGPLKDKLKGLRYVYMEYVSTPPKTIHLIGTYSNSQCLYCHAGMRSFDENPTHTVIMGSLKTNQISCISCHNTIHNASEVAHLKMWIDGDAPISVATAAASTAPEPAAPAAPSKAPAGNSAVDATRGKSIYNSQGCSGCHGASGGGGSGPALTHSFSQYPPAQLTAILKAPTAGMKAAGMAPLNVNAAEVEALVSYVDSLGGTSVASTPPGSPSLARVKAQPGGTPAPPKAASAATRAAAGAAPATAEPAVPAGPSKTEEASSVVDATRGESVYNSQGCRGCHGASGGGGSGPALTHTSSQYPPAQLTAILKAPTAGMKAVGMAPLSVNAADMEALVSYVDSLGGTSVAPAAAHPSAGSSSPTSATAEPAAPDTPSKTPAESSAVDATAPLGKSIYNSQGCRGCHGASGGGGSGPALTHTSSQYPPAQLTAILKAPTAGMRAAGMAPLSVNAADIEALVSYVDSLGGTSAAPAAAPSAGSSSAGTAASPKPHPKKSVLRWLFLP